MSTTEKFRAYTPALLLCEAVDRMVCTICVVAVSYPMAGLLRVDSSNKASLLPLTLLCSELDQFPSELGFLNLISGV